MTILDGVLAVVVPILVMLFISWYVKVSKEIKKIVKNTERLKQASDSIAIITKDMETAGQRRKRGEISSEEMLKELALSTHKRKKVMDSVKDIMENYQ